MIVGAACGFAVAVLTDSNVIGLLAGALAGMVLAAVFGVLVIGLATNQVATGLALTILGLGLAGLIGRRFVGQPRPVIATDFIPVAAGYPRDWSGLVPCGSRFLPVVGPCRWGRPMCSIARVRACCCALSARTTARRMRSACRCGSIRFLAILFGGLMAGLAGAYLSLIYTRFWSPGMTAGRGWIALALVVFAAGHVWRLVLGAYLFGGITVAQLHAQAGAIALPSQLLSALPYLMTIAGLALAFDFGTARGRGGGVARATLRAGS